MADQFDEIENQMSAEIKQVYTETVVKHAMNPRNVGDIHDADGYNSVTGPCGDTMKIWLKIKDGKIEKANFWTDGCGTTIACGSITTEIIKGKTVAQALSTSQDEILKALGGLPEDNSHCALLAANTLKAAIQDYLILKREPWRKAYRKS